MIEKEYYRLEELKDRFNLTEDDVRYLVEKRLVKTCFSIRNTKFIVDGWDGDNRMGYAHINYQGLIALPDEEVDSLISNGKITPLNYLLSRGGCITLVETDYPIGTERPKTFAEAWKPKSAYCHNADFIEAKLSPFVTKTFWHSYDNAKKSVNYSRQLFAKNVFCERELANKTKLDLPLSFNTLQLSELCIRHADLASHNLLTRKSPPEQQGTLSQTDDNIKLDNEFEDLLAAIILNSPQKLTAKKIHRILCDECDREEDSRLFDKNNILLSEDLGVITWRDKYRNNKHRSYSQASFDNIISQVRSKLSLHKSLT
ncbi:MAG: hypothetical protein NWQ54_10540 [Paraglaciecola sp.]|nr:hypothetical protein [Paraglaciecola sp.]